MFFVVFNLLFSSAYQSNTLFMSPEVYQEPQGALRVRARMLGAFFNETKVSMQVLSDAGFFYNDSNNPTETKAKFDAAVDRADVLSALKVIMDTECELMRYCRTFVREKNINTLKKDFHKFCQFVRTGDGKEFFQYFDNQQLIHFSRILHYLSIYGSPLADQK